MRINLQRGLFTREKEDFITFGGFKIKEFRYKSGIEALEVENERCSFIFTPFKGQQIWHFRVDDREISMQTTIEEPNDTMSYLENYGGFLYHCGVISCGAKDASYPQHGEIPNAVYDSAYVECGEDDGGKYICLGGSLNYDAAFVRKYRFSPEIKLYENSSLLRINVKLENLRAYPMEYMYLCHINFRPFDGAKLICSARMDAENVKIYRTEGTDRLDAYFDKLEEDISVMDNVGAPGQCYDPEICIGIRYEKDKDGRSYTMQCEAGGACYVSHPADILPNGVRWISRTESEDAMGMVLPATGEHLGYEYAKRNGQLKMLAPNEALEFYMEAGYIDAACAGRVKNKINAILKG